MTNNSHRCDNSCICPIHHTQLYYNLHYDQHACQDINCIHAHGLIEPKIEVRGGK